MIYPKRHPGLNGYDIVSLHHYRCLRQTAHLLAGLSLIAAALYLHAGLHRTKCNRGEMTTLLVLSTALPIIEIALLTYCIATQWSFKRSRSAAGYITLDEVNRCVVNTQSDERSYRETARNDA